MDATHEGYIPQECEFFGSNENGGLDSWGEPHCFGYEDGGVECTETTNTEHS